MIVMTITDTETEKTYTTVVRDNIAKVLFNGAEVGLDGADTEMTGFEVGELNNAFDIALEVQGFLRAQG